MRVERAVMKAAGLPEQPAGKRIAAVILAAGASTRLGEAKQLVTLGGERLLERAARIAHEAGCFPVVVVLGYQAKSIAAACALGDAHILINEAWLEGMSSSIRLGVGALQGSTDAIVFMTCDQPAVTVTHLERLMVAGLEDVTASAYDGRRGVPACFPSPCFDELLALEGDAGARKLIQRASALDLADGGIDVDTQEALKIARDLYDSR